MPCPKRVRSTGSRICSNRFSQVAGALKVDAPAALSAFYDTPPIYDTGPAGNILILPLPGYGALTLIRSRGNWKKALVDRLEPLDQKLAQACIACRQNLALEREVAEHRRTSADLSREKAYLDQLFDNAQVGIVMANNDGTVMRVNPEFVRIFGHPAEACIGKNIDALVSREDDHRAASEITRAVSHGEKHDPDSRWPTTCRPWKPTPIRCGTCFWH